MRTSAPRSRSFAISSLAAALCLASAGSASAAVTYRLDVSVRSEAGIGFSAPIFEFANASTPGRTVTGVAVSDGPPWDYVLNLAAPYNIVNPTGGSRTITSGNEANFDENNGGPTTIAYALSGFDPGEFFRFSLDPEASSGGSAVIDIRTWLDRDQLRITGSFGAVVLTGTDWTLDYFDPAGDRSADSNQVYRLTLQQTVVPEPGLWAMMIGGFGLAGAALRRARNAPRSA